jgi:NADH-quinone oxidoreductase subunit M
VLFFEGTIIGVFTSLNLMLFYVFWELVLLPMFFFIGVWGGPRRRYAAVKFLLFTYTGSVVMLLGFLALYLTGGFTFNLTELKGIPVTVQIFASIATFLGFGVKLPVFPLHTWLPDAHVEAPSPISVFLAGLLLKMGGYGFLRINLGVMPEASQQLAYIFMGIGVVTMLYGAVVAMIQTDLKRLIALTSINHMGFVIFGAYAGIASGTLTGLKFGVSGAIFQMFNHAAAIGILFMLSGYIHEQAGTRQIPSLRGLRWGMPRTATLLILGSMAGMGVPVFSSFISEYYIIVGAISVNVIWAVAILIPAVTVAYFLWMLRRTVMTPMEGGQMRDMSQRTFVIMTLYLIPLLLLLLFPSLILDPADAFSAQLFAAGR